MGGENTLRARHREKSGEGKWNCESDDSNQKGRETEEGKSDHTDLKPSPGCSGSSSGVESAPNVDKEENEEAEGLLPKISLPNIEMEIEKVAHWAWNAIPFDKLPFWLRDNEFLQHNHRPPMYSFKGCFKSMFRMHTETWNIWTHFLGFLFFLVLCMGVYVFGDYITFLFEDIEIHSLPWDEQAMLFLFFLGVMACLCCSFMFHLFSNHSHRISLLFCQLDYSGIAFLVIGSSIPGYYYGFYCTPVAKYVHISIFTVLCIATVSISLSDKFSEIRYRPLRFVVFFLFGLYAVVPIIHVILRDGYKMSSEVHNLWGFILTGTLYFCGGGIYVLRIPERFFPGKFDIWASSHQLFHTLTFIGILVYYDSLLSLVKYRLCVGPCVDNLPLDMAFHMKNKSDSFRPQ